MSAISALHVIDKSWSQHKADLRIIKYIAIPQHFEDKCVLYLAFQFSWSLFTSTILVQSSYFEFTLF